MSNVILYGFDPCGLCEKAKEKLNLMHIPFEFRLLEFYMTLHDGWRKDGSVELTALYYLNERVPPLIQIDDMYYTYPDAMRVLKARRVLAPAPEPEVAVCA